MRFSLVEPSPSYTLLRVRPYNSERNLGAIPRGLDPNGVVCREGFLDPVTRLEPASVDPGD